jgi:hypothetical protein
MDITNLLIDSIKNKSPISFSKYGDGEYFCAASYPGGNCDNDLYTEKKKNGLLASFKYMVDELPNSYIGWWDSIPQCEEQNQFWRDHSEKPIKWAQYHSLFIDGNNNEGKLEMYKTIKYSPLKKIYICNPLLVKAKLLLNIDVMIRVPFNNWFDNNFDDILEQIKQSIEPDEQCIIMTSAGMGAKVLIYELSKLFPNNIYLDFGSALDKICTKRTSRGWEPSYEQLMNVVKDIIPQEWDDNIYDPIYEEAKHKLGIHL